MNMPDLTAFADFNDAMLLGAGAILFVLQIFLWAAVRRQRRNERRRLDELHRLQGDVAALCSAATGVGERLVRVEDLVRRLTERHDQLELRAGTDRHYGQAIRLVQGGADADELIANCGLTRGEADLIVMLHGVAQAS
ncbi:MAG: DUF2802 domain-containing protein [Gammaproteobacteria bacterium]